MRWWSLRCSELYRDKARVGGWNGSGGALVDRAQGTGAAHRPRAAAQGDGAGLGHLLDAQRGEDGQQRLQLVRRPGHLEGDRLGVDVDHPGAEQLGGLQDLVPVGQRCPDLHQQQLPLDGGTAVQLDDLDDLDQLVQLLGDLLQRRRLRVGDDRHPGQVRVLRRPDGEGLDVEPAPAEQRRDPGQHTGLVLDQDGQGVAGHQTCPSPKTGRTSRAARISSLLAPAATIGHTWASEPTMKSMTTGASVIAMAFSITASTSSLVSQRSPTQPSASASVTKSGMRTCLAAPSTPPWVLRWVLE